MAIPTPFVEEVQLRAGLSRGISNNAIYKMVSSALTRRGITKGRFVDVGCGNGALFRSVGSTFDEYVGADVIRYEHLPDEIDFVHWDLNSDESPLAPGEADVVAAVETIEHLENPRSFMRQLTRLAKPGGWVIVTTPNQLSLLSLLTLLSKRRFSAFQDVHYPAHLTALLESDLLRIGAECGLSELRVEYSMQGRIVLTASHYPRFLGHLSPRLFSDNVLLIGKKQL